jgi:hypothetical protein
MELSLSHRFEAPLASVVDTLGSPDYSAHLARAHSFFERIELLERVESASHWQRRMHYRARPFIARLGVFSLPAEWFTWIERATYDYASGALTFENVPTLESVRDRVINRGQMRFRESLDELGNVHTVREAHFEIDFRVPAVYRPLKELALTMVRRQLESSLDEEAALLAGWLARDVAEAAA